MRRGQVEPLGAVLALLVLLTALAATVGLAARGWVVALAAGATGAALLTVALARGGRRGLGTADRVTVARGVLVGGVTALAASTSDRHGAVAMLVGLATLALVLDAVDGWIARRSGTTSPLGATLDMEVDAFLILVLSAVVARTAGGWALAIGLARYGLLAVQPVLPWLRAPLPPRFWAKVVAAVTGVVLTVAASGLLPHRLDLLLLVATLGLLAESFGRQVLALYRLHRLQPDLAPERPRSGTAGPRDGRSRLRTAVAVAGTSAAVAVTWAALVMPSQPGHLRPVAFLRIPVELLLLALVALVLGRRASRVVAAVFGTLLGLALVLKVLDVGFFTVFSRPVDPLNDWVLLGPAYGVLRDSVGGTAAVVAMVVAAVALLAVLSLLPVAAVRVTGLVAERRRVASRVVGVVAVAWLALAVAGTQLVPRLPVASSSTSALAVAQVDQVRADLADRATFARRIAEDRLRATPADQLLAGLRGKDVLLVFVESYGRVAVQGSSFAPAIRSLLRDGTGQLHSAGYASQSAYLTSPTFGAGSWLAHASLQAGLWVDSQQRYGQLLQRDRMTLTSAFRRAGWRTVLDSPADTRDWAEGRAFYRFDRLYTSKDVGYQGPTFSYARVPDQYTLAAFRRLELSRPHRPPVMAEIDLVSSHHPWAPLPRSVPWGDVGDGSIYRGMPAQGRAPEQVFRHRGDVRAAYGASIEYALRSLISYLTTYPDPDLVVVLLGDHQPHSYVTGPRPGFDVPVSVIAQDPAVMARVSGWGWEDGLLPSATAPVWRMAAFRDRFLTAFGAATVQAAPTSVDAPAMVRR